MTARNEVAIAQPSANISVNQQRKRHDARHQNDGCEDEAKAIANDDQRPTRTGGEDVYDEALRRRSGTERKRPAVKEHRGHEPGEVDHHQDQAKFRDGSPRRSLQDRQCIQPRWLDPCLTAPTDLIKPDSDEGANQRKARDQRK